MIKRSIAMLLAVLSLCLGVLVACGKNDDPVLPEEPIGPTYPDTPTDPDDGIEYCAVTVDFGDGRTETLRTQKGLSVQKPEDPSYGKHKFLGWYSNGETYDWKNPVYNDITVKALWEKVYDGKLKNVFGTMYADGNTYRSQSANSMAVCATDGFDRGAIEVTVTSSTVGDNGIVVGLTDSGKSSYWEGEGVSYYFFFLSLSGNAQGTGYVYLGKTDNGNWTALKVVEENNFAFGEPYTLKVVLDGTDLYCYVNGKLYIVFSERRFLTGTGYGIRAGSPFAEFSDFSVSGKVDR